MLRQLVCSLFHRTWVYGPVSDWPSSLYKECRTCGRTWASGIRDWDFYNNWNRRKELNITMRCDVIRPVTYLQPSQTASVSVAVTLVLWTTLCLSFLSVSRAHMAYVRPDADQNADMPDRSVQGSTGLDRK